MASTHLRCVWAGVRRTVAGGFAGGAEREPDISFSDTQINVLGAVGNRRTWRTGSRHLRRSSFRSRSCGRARSTCSAGLSANGGSEVKLSGGQIDDFLTLSERGTINIFGTEFFLDGVPLDALTLDEAF